MLRHRLPTRRELMLHREARANLKQRLLAALGELIHDYPPGVVSDGLVHVTHKGLIIRK